jgi:hypothetical protein
MEKHQVGPILFVGGLIPETYTETEKQVAQRVPLSELELHSLNFEGVAERLPICCTKIAPPLPPLFGALQLRNERSSTVSNVESRSEVLTETPFSVPEEDWKIHVEI